MGPLQLFFLLLQPAGFRAPSEGIRQIWDFFYDSFLVTMNGLGYEFLPYQGAFRSVSEPSPKTMNSAAPISVDAKSYSTHVKR